MKRRYGILLPLVFLPLVTACGTPPTVTAKVLETVNGIPITQQQVNERVRFMTAAGMVPAGFPASQGTTVALSQLEQEAVLGQKATALHIPLPTAAQANATLTQRAPAPLLQAVRKAGLGAYLTTWMQKQMQFRSVLQKEVPAPPVTTAAAQNLYNSLMGNTNTAQGGLAQTKQAPGLVPVPEIDVRHILVKSPTLAQSLLTQLQQGKAHFSALAKQYSIDPGSKTQGGSLGCIWQGEMVPSFNKAAFATTVGQLYPQVVHSRFGYHIIQVLHTCPTVYAPPFSQVESNLKSQLANQNLMQAENAYLSSLVAKAHIVKK